MGVDVDAATAEECVLRAAHAVHDVKAILAQHAGTVNSPRLVEESRRVLWEGALEAAVPVLEMLQWRHVRLAAAAVAAEQGGGGAAEVADAADEKGGAAAVDAQAASALLLTAAELQEVLAAVQVWTRPRRP